MSTSISRVTDYLSSFEREEARLETLIMKPNCPNVLLDRYIAAGDLRKNAMVLKVSIEAVAGYNLPSIANVVMAFALWVAADSPATRQKMWEKLEGTLELVKDEANRMGVAVIDLKKAAADVQRAEASKINADAEVLRARKAAEERRAKYDTMSWFGRVFVGVKD
ncbi:MAG: hypothetical protein LBI34_01575 [Puniceicoccales bacterium]|nr:hypothetical protein [Puniceicoccales bacterium]